MKRSLLIIMCICICTVSIAQVGIFKKVISDSMLSLDYRFRNLPNYSVYNALTNITAGDQNLAAPPGTTAQRPTVPSGKIILRYNTDSAALEFGNQSQVWKTLGISTAGSTDTSSISNFYLKVRSLISATAPLQYNAVTGQIAIPQASSGQSGYLASSDWVVFNSRLPDPGSNGILARTALGTVAARQLVAASTNVSIVNANGVSGNPSIDLNDTLILAQVKLTQVPSVGTNIDSVVFLNRSTGLLEVHAVTSLSGSGGTFNKAGGGVSFTGDSLYLNQSFSRGLLSASNGITYDNSTGLFKLGGTLSENTTITASTANRLTITGSADLFNTVTINNNSATAFGGLLATVSASSTGTAISGTTSGNGIGVFGFAGGLSGTGGSFQGGAFGVNSVTGSGIGIQGVSQIGRAFKLIQTEFQSGSASSITLLGTFAKTETITPGNGMGAQIDFSLGTNGNTERIANSLVWKWTNATDAARTSELSISGLNAGTSAKLFTLDGSGQITANKYGINTFSGTPAYIIGVDALGKFVEVATGPGGGIGTNLATGAQTATGDYSHNWANHDLNIDNIKLASLRSRGTSPLTSTIGDARVYLNSAGVGGNLILKNTIRNVTNTADSIVNSYSQELTTVLSSIENGTGSSITLTPSYTFLSSKDSLVVKGLTTAVSVDTILVSVPIPGTNNSKISKAPISALAATVNLSPTVSATQISISNTAGTGVILNAANATQAGLLLPGDFINLRKSYYIINGTGAGDSLAVKLDDSTTLVRRPRFIAGSGITITPAHTSNELVYTISSTAAGTLTSFTFTDGNGFDGTVTNATSTPTLSLTTTLTAGSIPIIGSGGILTQDNTNFNFDDVTNRLITPTVISPAATDFAIRAPASQVIRAFIGSNSVMNMNSLTSIEFVGSGLVTSTLSPVLNVGGGVQGKDFISATTGTLTLKGSVAGSDGTLGMTTNHGLELITNNTRRAYFSSSGGITFNTSTNSYTFPATRGTSGQVLSDIAGDGVLGWVDQTGGGGGGGVSGSGTAGRVAFWSGSTALSSDASFLFSTTNSTFSVGTTNTQGHINTGGNKNLTSSGANTYFAPATFTDAVTAASGTASSYTLNLFATPTIAATNASVTFPLIANVSIDQPTAGTNATITNAYALLTTSGGHVRFQGNLTVDNIASGATPPTVSGAMRPVMVDANGRMTFQTLGSTTSASSITPDVAQYMYKVTALAANLTINAVTNQSNAIEGQVLTFRLKDNGTSRTLTWNSAYRGSTDFALPTATIVSKEMWITVRWNSDASKWDATGMTVGH